MSQPLCQSLEICPLPACGLLRQPEASDGYWGRTVGIERWLATPTPPPEPRESIKALSRRESSASTSELWPGLARPGPCSMRAGVATSAARTWSSASSRRTAGSSRLSRSETCRSSLARSSTIGEPPLRRWTSRLSLPASPRSRSSTSSPTRTCPVQDRTPSDGRTCSRSSTRGSESSARSTSSTSKVSLTPCSRSPG